MHVVVTLVDGLGLTGVVRVVGPGVLLASEFSVDSALGHLIHFVYQNVAAFSKQLKQGIYVSFQFGEAVCWVAVMWHPASSASKTLHTVTNDTDFKSGSLLSSCVLCLHEIVKEAFGIGDRGQVQLCIVMARGE